MSKFDRVDVSIEKSFINVYFMTSSMELIDRARRKVMEQDFIRMGRVAARQSGKSLLNGYLVEDAFNQLYRPVDITLNSPIKTAALTPTDTKGVFRVSVPDNFFE